jgi:hypothetical protein
MPDAHANVLQPTENAHDEIADHVEPAALFTTSPELPVASDGFALELAPHTTRIDEVAVNPRTESGAAMSTYQSAATAWLRA